MPLAGSYLYLDQRNHFLSSLVVVPVDQGVITTDNMLFLHLGNLIG